MISSVMSQSIAALETTCFHCMAILLFFTESPPLCFASWSRDLIILSFSANHITYIFLSPLLLFDSHAPTIPLPLSSHQPIPLLFPSSPFLSPLLLLIACPFLSSSASSFSSCPLLSLFHCSLLLRVWAVLPTLCSSD